MDSLIVRGGAKLQGVVEISGSKNTALPLLFASILFDGKVSYSRVPRLWDIETTLGLMQSMGAETSWDKVSGCVEINACLQNQTAPYEWVRKMRAGILALGPLLAKYGKASVSLPGGCAIGARPVNFHLDAMRKMGASIQVEDGYIHATAQRLHGASIRFPQVSVTGTENILVCAALAEGHTRIENAAKEPEIVALGELLVRCGVEVMGLGTDVLDVIGVSSLKLPTESIAIPPDRIETGTWIAIAAATRSELELTHCDLTKLEAVLHTFEQIGVRFQRYNHSHLKVVPADRYSAIDVETSPYPGFPTDMQAQLLTVLCLASGESRVAETIFENRYMHVAELQRLGADIEIDGNLALVRGPVAFKAAPLMATDLRASASLVIAALAAKGDSQISRIYHLDRGYQRLDEKLRAVGASIRRVST